jgi:hypothetical protein
MSALQDLLSRALEVESHEVDMEADAECKERGHGEHDVFISAPSRLPQPVSTILIIDCCHTASVVNVASAEPVGVLLYPSLSPAVASFSSSSPTCSIQPRSSIFVVGELVVVTLAAEPLPQYSHALASKLLQQIPARSVVMLRCDSALHHAVRLCSSSWTAHHAPQLNAIQPMAFPHVLQGLPAMIATLCEADGVPCCLVSCPSPALPAIASTVVGAAVTFSADGQPKHSMAPPLYI